MLRLLLFVVFVEFNVLMICLLELFRCKLCWYGVVLVENMRDHLSECANYRI